MFNKISLAIIASDFAAAVKSPDKLYGEMLIMQVNTIIAILEQITGNDLLIKGMSGENL